MNTPKEFITIPEDDAVRGDTLLGLIAISDSQKSSHLDARRIEPHSKLNSEEIDVSGTKEAPVDLFEKTDDDLSQTKRPDSGSKPLAIKAARRKKWKKPKDKPKRPLSAYNIFFQAERERIVFGESKAQVPEESEGEVGSRPHRKTHGKIGFADLARNIGAKWKALPDSQKTPYATQAEMEQDRYRQELEEWKKTQEVRERDVQEWSDRRGDLSRDISLAEANETHEDSIAEAYHDAVDSKSATTLPMHLLAGHHKSVTAEAASNLRHDQRNEKWVTQILSRQPSLPFSGPTSLPKAYYNLQGSYMYSYPHFLHDGASVDGSSRWSQLSSGEDNVARNGFNEQAATMHYDMGSNLPPSLSYPSSLAPDQGDAMTLYEQQQYTLHQMSLLASRRVSLPPELSFVQDQNYRFGYMGGNQARNMQLPQGGGLASANTGVSNINMAAAQFHPYHQQDDVTHAHSQTTTAVSNVAHANSHGETNNNNAMVEHPIDEDCYDFLSRLRNAN